MAFSTSLGAKVAKVAKEKAARKAATVVAKKITGNADITVAYLALCVPVSRITFTRVNINTRITSVWR